MSTQPLIFQAIGTQWHIQLDDNMPAEFTHDLFDRIRERINLFEQDYSRFLPDSLLNVMSREPGRYSLPNDARPIMDLYQKLYVVTNGIFTPLIGQTLIAAGYDSSYSLQASDLHSPAAWDEVLEYAYPFLTVKRAVQLDFGGLGKGYVVDLVVNLLREHHVHSFCINAGGDIYYQNEGNAHISVGLEHPQDPLQALGVAHILNQSICGSSGSRRAWGNFHHIIDPHSLSSPKHILATWVVAQTTLLADAMATCLFLVPSSILLKEFEFEYFILLADYSVQKSANFPAEILPPKHTAMSFIDRFLNAITMYKVVLYGLFLIALTAIVMGFCGVLFNTGLQLLASLLLLMVVCYGSNYLLARILKVPANAESSMITALILFLIVAPIASYADAMLMIVVGLVAIVSKYLLVIHHKHIFNPAAIALLIMDLAGLGISIWWVANPWLLPIVIIVGFLIVRKVRRFSMFTAFLLVSLIIMLVLGTMAGIEYKETVVAAFTSWPLIFFGTVMLTEPQTAPALRLHQLIYAVIVAFFCSSQFHYGPFYPTPELALVVGNLFAYMVNSKQKLILRLLKKEQLSPNVYGFSFASDQPLLFEPGQYLEWTLPELHADTRGNRRYFTIASSPTESDVLLGVRTYTEGSSFKKGLLAMAAGDPIVVSQLSGEFILPKNKAQKLVFIAGGIGITPFRSMMKYLIDKREKRDVVLMYACAGERDFVYQDVFDQAAQEIEADIHYIVTEKSNLTSKWPGKVGYITKEMIQQEIPDFLERIFYISGPGAMVSAYKKLLLELNVSNAKIKTDYFPGF